MNSVTQESLELMKGALAQPDFRLAKSISTATGLLAFDLQAPAKNLYPFVTLIAFLGLGRANAFVIRRSFAPTPTAPYP